jgi:hypothetical protein
MKRINREIGEITEERRGRGQKIWKEEKGREGEGPKTAPSLAALSLPSLPFQPFLIFQSSPLLSSPISLISLSILFLHPGFTESKTSFDVG